MDALGPTLLASMETHPEDLYMTKNYSIEIFSKDNQKGYPSNNFVVRISNSFITALNTAKIVLPSVVVLILGNQFLKDQYLTDQGMPRLVDKLLWILHNTVKSRKKQLGNAYWEDHEPKIILLRPLPRPAYSLLDPQKYKTMRRLYAQHVEKITAQYRVILLNSDELNCSQRVLFDDFGNLSAYGTERFWKSLSDYFRRSDRDEYYAVKQYRTPKKTLGTQTFTQSNTNQENAAPIHVKPQHQNWNNLNATGDNIHHQNQNQAAHYLPQQPYQYQYGINDHYHTNHL